MTDPNEFSGSDSERMEAAVALAEQTDRVLRIPRRIKSAPDDREYWLIDRAILLPGDFTVILDGCTVRLSDRCRDNFFRSANCGEGIEKIGPLKNIRIVGANSPVLLGAMHPRATGDSAKTLNVRTYGTDGRVPEELQKGDWRNIGILFSHVEGFEISGLTLKDYHCWAVSLEYCSHGKVSDLVFDAAGRGIFDGEPFAILNQDGVDLRKGCHHIDIENLSGHSGDDTVALTAIPPKAPRPGGRLGSTEISGFDGDLEAAAVHHVNIRKIHSYAAGGHQIVRLLNTGGIKLHDVLIEDVLDTSEGSGVIDAATNRIGDGNPAWGGVTPLGDTFNVTVRKVDSRSRYAVLIAGSLADSVIEDIIDRNGENPPVVCTSGEGFLRNVSIKE